MRRRSFLAAGALSIPLAGTASAGATPKLATAAEQLAQDGWRKLKGRKVGVLTNPTGVLKDQTHIVDSMVAHGAKPTAVFGPEHGFRGTAQAGGSEGDYADPRTGIPVYDAYSANAAKLQAMFTKAGIDTVVFDIADVGARFYTYIWSMYVAMEAAPNLDFIVLDRPNPIGGTAHGPQLDPAYATFVGLKPIVQQHGMTVGELARYFKGEFDLATKLDVVNVRGWRRNQLDTGLPWVPPSPNMPTPDTALVYPGTCLFEGTVLSEGRGTTRPFETVGAPGIDWRWAEALNALDLGGVRFRETYFSPTFNKFQGKTCGGVTLHVTDPRKFDAIKAAVAMLITVKSLYPGVFAWRPDNWIDKLSGSDRLRRMIDAQAPLAEVVGAWQQELQQFRRTRLPYLRYR
ncbi:Uncharacterized conserved protein YbbC, DUF1343 family [Lentzea albidocapillata subsp. violacea]|uniref:Uncharacterized conserved protein YbbC, DUF1343 family n=1 Tax=Lentzea albidocapillata subsp. violacea TaxID=128104 RepID=A0A1G9HJI0_9PSEU|nr:DUF1343 domain-containing protein [Lentzea albidocapillata]SDL12904.1 Uncharacterized conserved protein YbbC, DUF1343 family [Lentzea albidocapillata subsp. violacea]